MKQYAIIPVADPVRPDALVSLLKEHNVEMYDHYAPRVWFVKYNGTVQQLTDLLWPDDQPADQRVIFLGVVLRIPIEGSNGFARTDLWEWLESPFDDLV